MAVSVAAPAASRALDAEERPDGTGGQPSPPSLTRRTGLPADWQIDVQQRLLV